MDVDERFQTILQECRWVRDAGTAARLIPALGAEAPAFVLLPQRDGQVRASVPVICLPMVASAVATTIVEVASGRGGGFEDLDAAGVAADPLAASVAEMFAQCARPGLRAQATPVLAISWCVWEVLGGRVQTLPGVDEALAQSARTVAAQVAAASGSAKTELLQAIGWALVSRIAGGLSLAGMAGVDVTTGGLYRQILSNPLLLGHPRGTLDRDPSAAAQVLGLSLEPSLVQAGELACATLLQESRGRLEAGRAEPLDVALQAVVPADLEPEVAAFHPTAGPALIAALPVLTDAKALVKAGVDKKYAKGLTAARGARAMTAAWVRLCEALGTWDVLSSLVARVVPLTAREGRMVGPQGALPADARWPMLLPRPDAAATLQAVVAVRLTEVRESLLGALHQRPWSLQNIPRAFEHVARSNGASVRQLLGDHAVCTFPAPELALRFALLLRRALGPDSGLELSEDDTTIAVPPTSALGIGLALGVVDGGTDGERSVLSGRGVAEAVALAGNGRAVRLHDDGVGVRSAGWGGGGFHNESVVASETFVRSMVERTRRRNKPVYVRGEGGSCGGLSQDFTLAPVAAWWEAGDGLVAAALLIDGETLEGAAELRVMTGAELREWHGSDRSAAALRRPKTSAAAPRSAPAPAPRPTAEPDHTASDFDQPSTSFMDGGSSPLRTTREPEPPPEVTTDPTTADGFLSEPEGSVEDGDAGFGFVMDETEEADVGGFSINPPSAASGPGTPAAPAPPMMLLDDDDEATESTPRISAPMMMMDDDPESGAGSLGFAMPDDSEPPRGPSAPMMLMDDDDDEDMGPPVLLDDDEDQPVGGLLGEVQGDPFLDESGDSGHGGLAQADSGFGPSGSGEPSGGVSMLHSTYQGEMELVGVAGFSLAGEETAQGQDPFHDPTENTGFYDERVSAHPRRPGDAAPAVPQADRPPDGAMVRELIRLLRGYVVVHDGQSHTFGLPDGGLLRDAWTHEGTEEQAYVGFLQSKVAEGFIPRADRVVALVPGVRPSPIEPAAIENAAGKAGL